VIVLTDEAIKVADQIDQQAKDLRFARDQRGAPPEFAPVEVKCAFAKAKFHGRSPWAVRTGRLSMNYQALSMNYQARLKDKSSWRESFWIWEYVWRRIMAAMGIVDPCGQKPDPRYHLNMCR
jgi:hypothetical protein